MIAALFVETDGVYFNCDGVVPYDVINDARWYRGPFKAICHPSCKRWGRYWSGGPSAKVKRLRGDDGFSFAHSLWVVRSFDGVIEHPEASSAWPWFGLNKPPRKGGWIKADNYGGWTCCVEQGHYGHPARKATWLYLVGQKPPELIWGPCSGKMRLDEGFHSKEERALTSGRRKRLSTKQNMATPIEFRDLLIELVASSDKASSKGN